MADDTIDLSMNYLLLDADGTAARLPGGADFWTQLMSGNASDPGIRRLMGSEKGRLLSVLPVAADWKHWEMHPAGDEILYMLEGEATFLLSLADGVKEIAFTAGRLLIVPQGVWHTARINQPGRLLAITAGLGTQHRPV
ncbi:MAG TPA: cupin domain-containing protein [Steroidobacteraceae bacterium]|jgi:mannose-6-phosphate isomerase-like protein (cupin superfamily)|nr:cupin domain-containing protein [Steroidobacteraceae bacterium]